MTALASAPPQTLVARPGVYDLPPEVYHAADLAPVPSLSSTGARKLLPPSCPALFAYEREHPSASTRELDLGKAAHRHVLGTGPELVLVGRPRWDTNEVKAELAQIRGCGAVPLKRADWDTVQAMADAIRANPTAAALLSNGRAEQAMFWVDAATGVWCRTMLDYLPSARPAQVMYVPEYKTTRTASPEKLDRLVQDHGYHIQAAWALQGIEALGLAQAAEWVWIWQEKTPPYLVTVSPIRDIALHIGRDLVRQAIDKFAECTASGRWPGYGDDELVPVGLPGWVENEYLREMNR